MLLRLIIGCMCLASTVAAAEPAAGTRIIHPADGAIMVYVPAGEFVMGIDRDDAAKIARDLGFDDPDELWAWEAFPRRTVHLDGFFIDQYEVTVRCWRKFAAAHPALAQTKVSSNHSDRPEDQNRAIGGITWAQAQRYANWAGKQLPSEAQWEKAARGTDGRLYPWGDAAPTAKHLLLKLESGGLIPQVVGGYPAGASPYGVLDMIGSQYEWTSQWFEPYPNNPEAKRLFDYTGHQNGCLRGGSTYHGRVSFYAAKRFGLPPDETHFHVGLRTVWQPPAGYFDSPAFEVAKEAAVPAKP